MSRYKAYPEYKDSGIEWLGSIPTTWNLKPLKFMAKIKNGQDYKAVEVDEGYPVIGSGGQFTYASTYTYAKESVLLGRKGTIDKPLYINEPFWTVDTMYYTEINEDIYPKFLYYLAITIQFARYSTNTALPSMTQEHLGNYRFAIPVESNERKKIANFLDYETAKIDTLIAKQQELIKLLKEKRQAVISHAVTKGLNPNAPMRDSGVEWLGEVPAHWSTSKIGFLATKIGSGKTPKGGSEIYKDEGILFLRSQNVYDEGLHINPSECVFITPEIHEEMNGTKVHPGDVLLNITGGSIGRSCLVPTEFCDANVNQHVCILRFPSPINEYLAFVIKSDPTQAQIDSCQTGGNREGLNFDQISKILIALPPLVEQEAIFSFLYETIERFDQMETKAKSAIEIMQERRTALISAAVTGKIDVRDWQPPSEAAVAA